MIAFLIASCLLRASGYPGMSVRIGVKAMTQNMVAMEMCIRDRLRLVPHATLTVEAKEMLAKKGQN